MMLVWLLPMNCARLWLGNASASSEKRAMVRFVFIASLHSHTVEPLCELRCLRVFKFKLAICSLPGDADQFPVQQICGRLDEIVNAAFGGELHSYATIGLANC